MPTPQTKELQRFNAMVGYLQKFMPNLSETNKILRQLCEDKVAFHWDQAHQAAFDKIKKMVAKTPVLKFYDINKAITIQTDASKFGKLDVLSCRMSIR